MTEHRAQVGRDHPRTVHPLPGDPLLPDVAAALAAVPGLTGAGSDFLDELGFRLATPATLLRPIRDGDVLVGRVVTLRYLPSRRSVGTGMLAHLTAVELARPGDVLVISAPSSIAASILGGQAARSIAGAGLGGVVADGYIRDLDEVAASGLPVWFRGTTPVSGRGRLDALEINGSIELAGITVEAGDIVIADRSGVVIIPPIEFSALSKRLLRPEEVDADNRPPP
jgi:4-hydroxy-4-methyl-2-oxoglutarate aldolase